MTRRWQSATRFSAHIRQKGTGNPSSRPTIRSPARSNSAIRRTPLLEIPEEVPQLEDRVIGDPSVAEQLLYPLVGCTRHDISAHARAIGADADIGDRPDPPGHQEADEFIRRPAAVPDGVESHRTISTPGDAGHQEDLTRQSLSISISYKQIILLKTYRFSLQNRETDAFYSGRKNRPNLRRPPTRSRRRIRRKLRTRFDLRPSGRPGPHAHEYEPGDVPRAAMSEARNAVAIGRPVSYSQFSVS